VLVCYDFHFSIFDEEDNFMFVIKSELFLIGTIVIPKPTRLEQEFISIPYQQMSG
jgi:hypothetical protein